MKEDTSIVEDNGIEMEVICWRCRGKKLIKIPFSGHLRYDQFKQYLKSNNYVHQILESLFNNLEGKV